LPIAVREGCVWWDHRGVSFSDPAMSLDETLVELLAMVGRRVDVSVLSAQPCGIVATYSGTLARAHDVQHESRAPEGEAFMFVMEEDYSVSFTLEARIFGGAGYVGAGFSGGVLEIRLGSAVLSIDARDDATP
jgi:hypothetical protein